MGETVLGDNLTKLGDGILASNASRKENQPRNLQGVGPRKRDAISTVDVMGHELVEGMRFINCRLVVPTQEGLL